MEFFFGVGRFLSTGCQTWQLVNILKCLLPQFVKLFDAQETNNIFYMTVIL